MAHLPSSPEQRSHDHPELVLPPASPSWQARLAGWRIQLRERHAWVLLLALFVIAFVVPNHTAATNLYRLFIVIPMLFCCSRGDWKVIWANAAARYFLLMCGYLLLTMSFDGWSHDDRRLLIGSLNVYGLFFLTYLVSRYQPQRCGLILSGYLWVGMLGAILIALDWDSLTQYIANHVGQWSGLDAMPMHRWDRNGATRGVFSNPIFVSWVLADLGIIAFHQMLRARSFAGSAGYALAGLVFAAITFCLETRAGYMMLATGILLLVLVFNDLRGWSALLMVAAIGGLLAFLFSEQANQIWGSAVDRGMSFRIPIWQNGINAITDSWSTLVFGHGLSASTVNQVGDVAFPHYHNFFLNHGYYSGLVGLGLCLAFLVLTLRKTFGEPQLQLWGVLLVAMLVGFLTAGKLLFVGLHAHTLAFFLPAFLGIFGLRLPIRSGREAPIESAQP